MEVSLEVELAILESLHDTCRRSLGVEGEAVYSDNPG